MPKPNARPDPTAEVLLPVLIEVFRERGVDRLPTEEVVAAAGGRLGRPITANRLARTLKPYGAPPRQFRLAGERVWGYLLADLARGRDAEPPVENRDAGVVEPLVPDAADHLDAAREWSWHLALASLGH